MARRSNIDWEASGRDYCAGTLSIAEVAARHKVSDSQLRAKAKEFGWQRDLSAAIAARTKAKLAVIDVAALVEQSATESAGKSADTIRAAIESASDVAAGVAMRHRAQLKKGQARAESIEKLLDRLMVADGSAIEPKDVNLIAVTFKSLVEARAKLIDKERQSYGMDDGKPPDNDPLTDLLRSITSGNASTVKPVRADPELDD